jgi:hypothetical protein
MHEMVQAIRSMKQSAAEQTIAPNLAPHKSSTFQRIPKSRSPPRRALLATKRFTPKHTNFHPSKAMMLQSSQ